MGGCRIAYRVKLTLWGFRSYYCLQCVPLYSHRPYFPFGSGLGNRISHAFEGATATPDIPLLVTPISCIRVGFTNVTRLTQHLQVLNIKFSFWVL